MSQNNFDGIILLSIHSKFTEKAFSSTRNRDYPVHRYMYHNILTYSFEMDSEEKIKNCEIDKSQKIESGPDFNQEEFFELGRKYNLKNRDKIDLETREGYVFHILEEKFDKILRKMRKRCERKNYLPVIGQLSFSRGISGYKPLSLDDYGFKVLKEIMRSEAKKVFCDYRGLIIDFPPNAFPNMNDDRYYSYKEEEDLNKICLMRTDNVESEWKKIIKLKKCERGNEILSHNEMEKMVVKFGKTDEKFLDIAKTIAEKL